MTDDLDPKIWERYGSTCPNCGGLPDDETHRPPCETCGYRTFRPTLTVRWWRDPETRFLSRPEYREWKEAHRFNLSEVPRGDNPELDAFVEHWRDTHGFLHPNLKLLPPLPFERLDPDPLKDIAAMIRYSPVKIDYPPMFFWLGEKP